MPKRHGDDEATACGDVHAHQRHYAAGAGGPAPPEVPHPNDRSAVGDEAEACRWSSIDTGAGLGGILVS